MHNGPHLFISAAMEPVATMVNGLGGRYGFAVEVRKGSYDGVPIYLVREFFTGQDFPIIYTLIPTHRHPLSRFILGPKQEIITKSHGQP